jgi:hypothetical protein
MALVWNINPSPRRQRSETCPTFDTDLEVDVHWHSCAFACGYQHSIRHNLCASQLPRLRPTRKAPRMELRQALALEKDLLRI